MKHGIWSYYPGYIYNFVSRTKYLFTTRRESFTKMSYFQAYQKRLLNNFLIHGHVTYAILITSFQELMVYSRQKGNRPSKCYIFIPAREHFPLCISPADHLQIKRVLESIWLCILSVYDFFPMPTAICQLGQISLYFAYINLLASLILYNSIFFIRAF